LVNKLPTANRVLAGDGFDKRPAGR